MGDDVYSRLLLVPVLVHVECLCNRIHCRHDLLSRIAYREMESVAMSTTTGTTSYTIYADEQGEYHPCRCGLNHRGIYATEDWMMHNCFHDQPLLKLDNPDTGQLMCVLCGQIFNSESGP